MKKRLLLSLISVLLIPLLGFPNAVSIKVGYFFPRAQGGPDSLWTIEFENMDFTRTQFQESIFGFSFDYFLTKEISLTLSVEGYSKNRVGRYKDYVGYQFQEGDFAFPNKYYQRGDFVPSHVFNVSITPFQLSLKATPFGRRTKIIPYVGGGIGLYLWNVRLQGDTIDFNDPWIYEDPDLGDVDIYPINLADLREENKISLGYHAFGGVMFPFGRRIAFEVEFKYNSIKGKLTEAFKDFEDFDLSSYQFTIGINYWF